MSLNYDLIKDKITIRMVPRDKGEALCCAFPDLHIYDAIHIPIGGMCAVFCLGTKNNSIITDQTLDALNITEYEFKSDVFENAAKNNPAVMKSLVEIQNLIPGSILRLLMFSRLVTKRKTSPFMSSQMPENNLELLFWYIQTF